MSIRYTNETITEAPIITYNKDVNIGNSSISRINNVVYVSGTFSFQTNLAGRSWMTIANISEKPKKDTIGLCIFPNSGNIGLVKMCTDGYIRIFTLNSIVANDGVGFQIFYEI